MPSMAPPRIDKRIDARNELVAILETAGAKVPTSSVSGPHTMLPHQIKPQKGRAAPHYSELDHIAIGSDQNAGGPDLVQMGENSRVHMGHHDALGTKLRQP